MAFIAVPSNGPEGQNIPIRKIFLAGPGCLRVRFAPARKGTHRRQAIGGGAGLRSAPATFRDEVKRRPRSRRNEAKDRDR